MTMKLSITTSYIAGAISLGWIEPACAFRPLGNKNVRNTNPSSFSSLSSAPRRLEENVDGPLFVNDKVIIQSKEK